MYPCCGESGALPQLTVCPQVGNLMSNQQEKTNEVDAPQIASEDEILRQFEEELLQSSTSASTGLPNDPQVDLSEAVGKLHLNKRGKLNGASRKRLKWLIKSGLDPAEARIKALQPIPPAERVSVKRPRSEESTPSSTKAEKRVKTSEGERKVEASKPQPSTSSAPPLNFKEAVKRFKVGILHTDYPDENLSKEQQMLIQGSILSKVAESTTISPQFSGVAARPGWLCVTCDDKATAEWLVMITEHLKPWEGATLKAVEEKDLPRSKIVGAFLPNSSGDDNELISKMLKAQNPSLNTAEWRIIRRSNQGTAAHLLMSVDITSFLSLKKADFRVCFKFGKVVLRPKNEGKEPQKKPVDNKTTTNEATNAASTSATQTGAEKAINEASTSGTQASTSGTAKATPKPKPKLDKKRVHTPPLDPPRRGYRPGKGKEYKDHKPRQ